MAGRTGGQLVVDTLRAAGVEVIFGIPGVHTLDIYDALLDQPELRHILNRHEQGSGFMADGYARASGRPGVCIVITGPGLTNLATPLGQAYSDSSPVVVISSEIASDFLGKGRGELHELKDQAAFMRQLTRWQGHASAPGQIPSLLAEALVHHRRQHPGPVHLQVPLDVLAATAPAPALPTLDCLPLQPDSEQVELATAMLVRARQPVMVVGAGAQSCGSSLTALAECLGAPVFTTALGRGVIPDDHPLAMGQNLGREEARDLLTGCDLLLALGTRLRPLASANGFAGQLIQVNLDGADLGRIYPPQLAIRADAGAVVDALLQRLTAAGVSKAAPPALPSFPEKVGAWTQGVFQAIRHGLGRWGILAVDMTLVAYRASQAFPVYHPRTFLSPDGFGTLGFAAPAAMGAHLACPRQRVVALAGDGGFMFTLEELAVAVQEKLAVTIVVVNSASYEVVGRMHQRRFGRRLPVELATPDLPKLAQAFGVDSLRVKDGDALAYALDETALHPGPVLIELPYQAD